MAKISVGLTSTGKAILIDGRPQKPGNIENDFAGFSDQEAFQALLVAEYLSVCELRREKPDTGWFEAIIEVRDYLRWRLGGLVIVRLSAELGIESAFAARDYGRALVHSHFRAF